MFGVGVRDFALRFVRDREATFPAILCSTVVLRGQRAAIDIDGHDARRAVQATHRRRTGVVLLPSIDGIAVGDLRVGTLVDIEDEAHGEHNARKIDVFGRHAVTIVRISAGRHLAVVTEVRAHWAGDDSAWVAQVEALGKRVRLRASAASRTLAYKPRSYAGVALEQLVVEVAGWLVHGTRDREQLLEEDLLGQLRILDNALRVHLKTRRTQRDSAGQRNRVSARRRSLDEQEDDQELPSDIQQAIEEQTSRADSGMGSHTAAEAVRFVKSMKWVKPPPMAVNVVSAQDELNASCYGMETVKEHVLDFLASWEWSRQRGGGAGPPGKVLCLLGPPGVGKTAIAAAVAAAMGRTLIRMPMGGIDDVFLIGADQAYQRGRPGEIARRIREAGRHPSELVFLLDEIDKVADKSNSAVPVLLALLDREQQAHFRDHFLDAVTIDLSSSVFICTANTLDDIAPPLRDRLQPLVLAGYSKNEQVLIGTMHLLPRLRERLHISGEVRLSDGVIRALVEGSAASPGMRQLQGQLETVLTRGLRRYLESAVTVCVGIEEALQWSVPERAGLRRIGFQTAAAREPAEHRSSRSALDGDDSGIVAGADRAPGSEAAGSRTQR